MSNDPKSDPRPTPKPAAAPVAGEVRMRLLRFVSTSLPINSKNSSDQSLTSRPPGSETGWDLYFVAAERHYRLERWTNGKQDLSYWMHESRVEFGERL